MSMKNVLITGASSAMGARVLELLAERHDIARIYLLSQGDASLPASLASARSSAAAKAQEVLPLSGDVRLPRLGLDERAFDDLCAAVDTVFHCAERAEIDQDLEKAREGNVQPVRTLIALLEKARGARLVQLSTTWVAGTKRGLFTEFDLDCGQGFYNAYEQSKHEAERLLRDSSVSGRVTVVRRSLALGGPQRGVTAGTMTLESVIQSLLGGWRILVSGDPRVRVDVIPMEYLAEGAVALADHPGSAGRTCHLVAGWEKSWTLRELVEMVQTRCRTAQLGFLPPLLASPARLLSRLSFGRVAAFPGRWSSLKPYLHQRSVFDGFLASNLLEPLGVTCPPPAAFMARVLDAVSARSIVARVPAVVAEAV
jgi:nucleoside-diphosphate-sugar epimerase